MSIVAVLLLPFAVLLPFALVVKLVEWLFEEPPVVAERCAWCRSWLSARDEALASEGIPVSDGICTACEVEHFPVEAA